MMSEDYDHRWEPLAEIHFSTDNDFTDENYIYCLCSRVFIRDGVKLYFVEKEIGSESDIEVLNDSKSQGWSDESHVHFSADTSHKAKCEKDEGASCYCSATHTDNYYSTDEHDPGQAHGTVFHALQPSDSGADLTYQDNHSDLNAPATTNNLEDNQSYQMEEDLPSDNISGEFIEDYHSEHTFDKFWAVNGERLIWASWITNYSDYINPAYLNDSNDLCMDENNVPKEHLPDQASNKDEGIRERKFSYDSKVNPYKRKPTNDMQKTDKQSEMMSKADWLPIARRRSCSEHDRMLSPRTLDATDSMTNVTKMTLSSYDVTSSHVTSESTPSDDYSVSSSTSDDRSNDQTRLCNIDENLERIPIEEMESDQYWQLLWKKHFGEQYALHLANYLVCNTKPNDQKPEPIMNVTNDMQMTCEKSIEIDCENSEGNSQEMPSVIEVQSQVDRIKLEDLTKPKKRDKKLYNRYVSSVGVLLQSMLKDEQTDANEAADTTDSKGANSDAVVVPTQNLSQIPSRSMFSSNHMSDGGDEPPEDTPVTLKRSHEEDADDSGKIKETFEIMGFALNPQEMPRGQLVYQKRLARLRPPRSRRFDAPRKTYFDDDGNPYTVDKESQDEREMQTDDDCSEVKSSVEATVDQMVTDSVETLSKLTSADTEAILAPLPLDASFGDEEDDEHFKKLPLGAAEGMKRRRRKRRRSPVAGAAAVDLPPELLDDPKMKKYWKKRHSLFHRFDEGIKLDTESWFSVTPEKVARHLAERCRCDLVVDAFCGAGGNAIQFAWTCERVIAIDIDPVKIELARHNAAVYGVADRIEFIVGDFFALAPQLTADVVFLSPPWGGPQYSKSIQYDLETMLVPKPSSELMAAALNVSQNVALYVPRNSRTEQLVSLAKSSGAVEIEQNYLERRFVALTAYYGELVNY